MMKTSNANLPVSNSQAASKRVLLGGLFHETNTFVGQASRLSDFQILRGDELFRCAGDSSPLGGALESAQQFGWTVLPTVDFRGIPGGTVDDEVLEIFWSEFVQRALPHLAQGVDGIYLVLHGAMVTRSIPDCEGEILERIRRLPNATKLPIFGVIDLHANFSPRMARHSNCLVAYRQNPHTDARQTAQRAASLLDRSLGTGQIPKAFSAQPAILWPPTGTATASEPMSSLEKLARDLEQANPDFWAVNVLGGFCFADVAEAGASFSINTTGSEEAARSALSGLCQLATLNQAQGNVIEPPLEDVIPEILRSHGQGLTVLVEPSDNIGAGAAGDGTSILRALLKHRVQDAAIAIQDPEAVGQTRDLLLGTPVTLAVGGKTSSLDPGPVRIAAQLISRSDGKFRLEDPQSHLASLCGDTFDMGSCAVVRCEGILILLTSHPTPPFDLGQWRSQGIDPEKLSLVVVKAAVAHRRAYDPIARRMFWVKTPGPCCSDLTALPYRNVRRPIYPLDSIVASDVNRI